MNRTALGLAIGAGYLLGRTKKLKMAVAVGSLVAGKKLNLGPGAIADLARQQLRDNPQFKEIGEQLREDLRGVGKAASGAVIERRMNTLADRLHDRTAQVREELSGALPEAGSDEERDEEQDGEREQPRDEGRDDDGGEDRAARGDGERDGRGEKSGGRKGARKAPPKASAARQGAAKKTAPAKKTAAEKTGSARRTTAKKATGSRGAGSPKGGDDR